MRRTTTAKPPQNGLNPVQNTFDIRETDNDGLPESQGRPWAALRRTSGGRLERPEKQTAKSAAEPPQNKPNKTDKNTVTESDVTL